MRKKKIELGLLQDISSLISPWGWGKFLPVALLVVIQAFVQVCSLLSIAPVFSVLLSPDPAKNGLLIKLSEWLGFMPSLAMLLAVFVGFQLVNCLVNLWADWQRAMLTAKYGSWIKKYLLRTIMTQPYKYFSSSSSSVLQKVIETDTTIFTNSVFLCVLDLLAKSVIVGALVLTAFVLSPVASILFGLVGGLYYGLTYFILAKKRNRVRESLRDSSEVAARSSLQLIQGIKMVRTSGKQEFFFGKFEAAAERFSHCRAVIPFYGQAPRHFMELLLLSVMAMLLWYTGKEGSVTTELPAMGALAFAGLKIMPALQGVYGQLNTISNNAYVIPSLIKEMSLKAVKVERDNEPIDFKQSIKVDSVRYSHAEKGKALTFSGIDIKKGQTIGIVGKTGAGKSTLMDLLLGLLKPDSGAIKIDGVELTEANLCSWQQKIGYVGQDPYLIEGTIVENIAIGESTIGHDDAVSSVSKLAQIHDYIMSLPDGYETQVGDRGVKLSGGQKQRIAIARALYRKPSILFFDEATSALDNDTEQKLMDTVYALPDEMTVIMIAHRLTTLDRADRIIELS